jgi:hypothetical protein
MNMAQFGIGQWTRGGRALTAAAVGLIALCAAAPATPARADAPTITTTHTVFTRISPFYSEQCGFPVTRHRDLTIRQAIYTRNGVVVKELDNYQDVGYVTANGLTVTYSEAGPNRVTYYADGSVEYSGAGLFYNFHGTGFRFAGRVDTLVDANGEVISDTFGGVDQGSLADVCAALTP